MKAHQCPVSEIRTLYDGLARFPARSAARRDAGASQAARDDVRGPRKPALRVAFPVSSGRRKRLTMAHHRPRVPSCRGNGKNDRIVHESLRQDTKSAARRDAGASREPRDDVRWPPMAARRVAFRAFWERQRRLTLSIFARYRRVVQRRPAGVPFAQGPGSVCRYCAIAGLAPMERRPRGRRDNLWQAGMAVRYMVSSRIFSGAGRFTKKTHASCHGTPSPSPVITPG